MATPTGSFIANASTSPKPSMQYKGATSNNLTITIQDGTVVPSIDHQLDTDLSGVWILVASFLVFFMQGGFALLEAGSVRKKNIQSILVKNVVNTCLSVISWWLVGHSFAQGDCSKTSNPIIGLTGFLSSDSAQDASANYWALWLNGWAFAAVAATIPSGALAERCQVRAYIIYTLVQSGLTYPLCVHAIWSTNGWLSPFRIDCSTGLPNVYLSHSVGAIDFAGSANVHITGGGAALVGAIIIQARRGRFEERGSRVSMTANNPALQVLGTMVLWFGWYGFNSGSTLCLYRCMHVAALTAVNTTLAAAAGGLGVLFLQNVLLGRPCEIGIFMNGMLAGLVGITSGCSVVQSYSAVLIGAVASAIYLAASAIVFKCKIDDPLDSAACHFFCGIWGVVAVGLFATKNLIAQAYPATGGNPVDYGVFYGGSGYQLVVQILCACAVSAWVIIANGIVFGSLRYVGWLRVSDLDEDQGLDDMLTRNTGSTLHSQMSLRERQTRKWLRALTHGHGSGDTSTPQ